MAGQYVQDAPYTSVGYEQIAVSDTVAVGFTAGVLGKANVAVLRPEATHNLRFRTDGVAPTSSVGFPWKHDDKELVITLENMSLFKMISQSGNISVNIHYYIR